jgi:thiaminase/transcriptional activator TenA
MSLTERLREDADFIWKKIFEHPFVIELYDGTLPLEKFKYYIIQDYNYLIEISRCFSIISSKSDFTIAKYALQMAYMDMTTEMDNYMKLLGELGLDFKDVVKIEPAPTNFAYMNFLIRICSLGSPIEGLVALLPCFWTYKEIAEYNKGRLVHNTNTIYKSWANTYLSSEYENLVNMLKNIIDASSYTDYDNLKRIFILASKYEYMFWEMAYTMEKWKI